MSLTRSVIFNGVDLSTLTNVSISGINYNNMPTRNVQNYTLARTEGRKHIAAFYDDRQIEVFGQIIDSSGQGAFESDRATLMQNLTGQDVSLDIVIGNIQTRFFATCTGVIFSDPNSSGSSSSDTSAGLGVFTITFECSSPFGIDPNMQTGLASTVITTTPSTQNLGTIQGTYQCAPYLSVYLTSGSVFNLSTSFMKLTNPLTGKSITITRAFSVGELLVIDVFNKLITVNNVAVDYTGNLDLFWALGAGGTITYSDNFTTRSVKLIFQYFPRFL